MQDFQEISYAIDADDRLIDVSEEWGSFARGNGGKRLQRCSILGHSLWSFIGDEPTRELYQMILEVVRDGQPVSFIQRCDSPARRRLVEMQVTPRPAGGVQFRSILLSRKDRPAVRLLEQTTPRTSQRILSCNWCSRVHAGGEAWLEAEEAVTRLRLRRAVRLPRLESVVCPHCYGKIMEVVTLPTTSGRLLRREVAPDLG